MGNPSDHLFKGLKVTKWDDSGPLYEGLYVRDISSCCTLQCHDMLYLALCKMQAKDITYDVPLNSGDLDHPKRGPKEVQKGPNDLIEDLIWSDLDHHQIGSTPRFGPNRMDLHFGVPPK